jgi:adenine deaminase
MRRAVTGLGGGIATADGWQFPLPIAGMMSPEPFAATVRAQADLDQRMRALTCDFLPGRRLTVVPPSTF